MAESGGPLMNGGRSPVNGSVSAVVQSVEQLCSHVTDFQRHINLQLLVPRLVQRKLITRDEKHQLRHEAHSPDNRILSLVTEILPRKGGDILQQFRMALEDTLEEDGSQGHETLLKKFFGMNPSSSSDSDSDEVQQPTANTISDESEDFSILLMNFTKILESGNDKDISRRLKDIVNYLWPLKRKNNSHLVKRSARDELFSSDLTFSRLFDCLASSNPPVISYNDVSMLHRIIDKVLKQSEVCKKIIEPLQRLLHEYEKESGIALAAVDPEIPDGSARIKAKVTNATNPDPKLKNGVKRSLLNCFWMNFRGSGVGSVIFYWDFPEEYIQQVKEGCENVSRNNTQLGQLKITKVEVQLDKPCQINIDMEITDPILLKTAQTSYVITDDIAPEQEEFVLFLMKVDHLVGTCAETFLSIPRKEISRPYAQFEGKSFSRMTDILISQDRLHCYDISYIQQFLLSLLKWDTSQGSKHKEMIITLLKEAQDYEPVPTGSPLPSLQLQNRSHSVTIVTCFHNVYSVSYEVMMTLKYALLQLLYLFPSSLQYVRWIKVNRGCQITWKTSYESLEKVEDKLSHYPYTAALKVVDDFEVQYPYRITFSCNITNMQILLDGSPLLYPDLDDCSLNLQLDMLCRVGHVCATCFIEHNSAFRLLWLCCFKPFEHQFVGKVNAVYDMSKLGLCRVRKLPARAAEQCPVKSCANGRKCTKAHTTIELKYWNSQQGRKRGSINYSTAVSRGSTVKHFSMVKKRHHKIEKNPSLPAITSKLLPSNYQKKFHHLLYWEELQHIEELNQRCTDPVDVVICNDVTVAQSLEMNNTEYAMVGYVVMKDADSAKYVMQASHSARLVLPHGISIEADVVPLSIKHRIEYFSKLNMEYVPIALNSTTAASLKAYCIGYHRDISKPISKIPVKFFIKHSYFKDLHQAVDNILQVMIQRLFPSVSVAKKNFQQQDDNDFFITNLEEKLQAPFKPDKLQLKAISSMLSVSADVPFLLVGPFGTGKTHVLACAAAAIVKEDASAKVLIATHHNKSADTFVSKYFGTIESTKTLPLTVAPIRIASKDLSNDVEKPYFVRFNDPIITKELLDERRIVVTTFLTALHFASTEKVPRGYFTHILIDEGAQTREPETIGPLIFADDRSKVIIAGDHLQVGPKTVVLGEKAISYGLADSLIERLYNHYDKNNQWCPWIFNLLINYRSHEAIMRLSSNLFYNSTVVSKSNSRLHPHTCYPLHFICTSLEEGTFQDVSDIHCDEADVVLREVKKYTEPWPKQWGKRGKSSVCIVASSRNQVIQLQTKLNKLQINSHSYIEVLPSFDLQGREFRAIFVSTTEATDVNGCCKNPTKSMTDPFVFNTVITRAQSLVVCVGNPYFLCHLEEKTKPGNKCWSKYIKCCFDYETFSMVNSSFGQMEKERLQSGLCLNSSTRSQQELSSGDKIIKGYLKSLAQFESHKKALRFSKSCGDIQWVDNDHGSGNDDVDVDDNDSTFSDLHSDSLVECVIDLQSRYQAIAQPIGKPGLVIHIIGQRNLRGAFHESSVLVELINSPSYSKRQDEKKVYNGKVVKLISLSNLTFLCEVDHRNFHRFFPINKKDPAFFNLPMLSKAESGVAVFDSQSLKDVPRVVQVFPPQLASKRIFIVQYLHWNLNRNFKNPVGVVIDSISKGYTYSAGEKLLCAQYKFDFDAELDRNYKSVKPVHPQKCDEMFAIIEKSGEILENAFSVRAKDKYTYIISYYVVNIAGCIEDERLTDLLKKRGVSAFVKTDKLNKWRLHSMFPLSLLKSLNFDLNKPCSCFRISCMAEMKSGSVTYKSLENSIEEVFGILTKTYTQQQMESGIETQTDFMLLLNIARCLQLNRLGYSEATYNCVFDISETPRAQLVLKEFSSWANHLVAMKLANSSLTLFPLRCKLPPNPEEKKSVFADHGEALQTSVHNKYFLPKNGYKLLSDVKIYRTALPLLLEALKDQHIFKYLAMLSYDNFFPQLHVASQRFRSMTKAKEFVLRSDNDEIDFTSSHDSASYSTMFTSPLTSFFDIVVQDMLSAALNRQPSKYSKGELDFICGKANKDFKRKSDFVEDMFNLQLGVTLKAFNHSIVGYIEKIDNKNRLTLSFPSHELKNLSEHQSSFNIAHLLAFKNSGNIQFPSKSSINLYEWNIKVASFTGPPSIFTSPTVVLQKIENADATIDITLFLASSEEEEKSHFYIELDKKHLNGSVESSAVSVSQHEWKELTKIMSPDLKDLDKQCEVATKILSSCCTEHLQRQSFKHMAKQTVCWSGTVRRKLQQKYDSLHAWFGAAQDTALIYPKIQQIEIAPFLKVCIQHNSEPEKCFANITLVNASRESYSDIEEYMELWGQVVIAENAISSVRTRDILLLENVALQWPKLEYCCDSYAGDYYRVPKDEFVIMKPPEDFNKSNIELFDLQRGDLLCVQYEVPEKKLGISMGFVFHMFVDRVSVNEIATKDNGSSESSSEEDSDCESSKDLFSTDSSKSVAHEKLYYLSFSQSVEKISEKFNDVITKDPNCNCKVQILHISPPQRRIYRCLRNLHRASNMTQYIACGDTDAILKVIKDSKFSVEEISSVLNDEKVLHLWDKPGKKLSTNQMAILRKACKRNFLIIHGPPGTGKSTVGAHLAYACAKLNQITKKKKTAGEQKNRCVIYCGASNISVDVVAKMLCDLSDHKSKQQKHRVDKLKVLRVYPNNIEQSVYPNPFELLHDSEASSVNENLNFKKLKLHSLHYKIRYECGSLGETIKTLERHFNENKQRERFASKADRMKYRKAISDAEDKILSDDIDILICTCNEMASARIFRNIEAVQVIIDEAAMVTEPETMIPIQRAEQVILIGDHQQLQPKVHSKHADRSGLTTSLFQRYVDVVEFEFSFLNEQFRMHKKIFEFPASQFYKVMKLLTNQNTAREMESKARSLKTFWPNQDPSTPFVFCDVIGTEKVTDAEFIDKIRVGQESKYNPEEADKIVEIVKVLHINYGVKQEDILALSPYQAQCKHIHNKLKSNKLSDVKCTTVKSSEGNECGIVLLSTVRSLPLEDIEDPEALIPDRGWLSENLGFLTDKHIINVGITRCQYGLVVVGNKCLLDYDDTWSNLIYFCSKHGNVIPEKYFPSRSDIEKIRGFSVRRKKI